MLSQRGELKGVICRFGFKIAGNFEILAEENGGITNTKMVLTQKLKKIHCMMGLSDLS